MKFSFLGAIFLSAFLMAGRGNAATILPETDTSEMFNTIAERDLSAGTDPRTDTGTAVQTIYFEYREAIVVVQPEAPFAPQLPRVAPFAHEMVFVAEEKVLATSR